MVHAFASPPLRQKEIGLLLGKFLGSLENANFCYIYIIYSLRKARCWNYSPALTVWVVPTNQYLGLSSIDRMAMFAEVSCMFLSGLAWPNWWCTMGSRTWSWNCAISIQARESTTIPWYPWVGRSPKYATWLLPCLPFGVWYWCSIFYSSTTCQLGPFWPWCIRWPTSQGVWYIPCLVPF